MRNVIHTLIGRSTSCPLHQLLQRVWLNFRNILLQILYAESYSFCLNSWPAESKGIPTEVHPYFSIRDELTVDNEVILKGLRVVVPQTLRKEYLSQLHKGHPGMDAAKMRARETVYWRSLMLDIGSNVAS